MKQLLTDLMLLDIDSLYWGRFDSVIQETGRKIEKYREAVKVYELLIENKIYHPETKISVKVTERITLHADFPDLEEFEREGDNNLEKKIQRVINRTKRLCKLNATDSDMMHIEHYRRSKKGRVYYTSLGVFPLHPEYLKRHQMDKEFTHSANSALIPKK